MEVYTKGGKYSLIAAAGARPRGGALRLINNKGSYDLPGWGLLGGLLGGLLASSSAAGGSLPPWGVSYTPWEGCLSTIWRGSQEMRSREIAGEIEWASAKSCGVDTSAESRVPQSERDEAGSEIYGSTYGHLAERIASFFLSCLAHITWTRG